MPLNILTIVFLLFAVFSIQETSARDILRLYRYTVADGLPNNIINSITEDSNGNIWIGTWNGLCCWHNNTIVAYTETRDHKRLGRIRDIWEDCDGCIGYIDESGEYYLFEPKSRKRKRKKVASKPIIEKRFRHTLGKDKNGLYIYHNQMVYHIPFDENNRTESRPRAFFEDSKGRLWFNFNGTLYMVTFVASPFFHFISSPYTDNRFNATVRSIFCNRQGMLLFGTRNAQLHGLTKQPLNLIDDPYSIIEDNGAEIWVAMRDSGISIIRKPYADINNQSLLLKGIPIFSLLGIPDTNEIWAGTWGNGIYVYNAGNKNLIPTDSILVNEYIHSMNKRNDGNIVVCTKNGLRIVSPDKHIIYSTDTAFNIISAIETKDKRIVFSTMGKGLYSLSEIDGKHSIHEVKMPHDDVIMDMLYDYKGYLWMIADTRLFRFDSLSDDPEIFDSNDFGKDLTFTEAASCLYEDSLLYLGVTPGVLEINLNELNHYVKSRNLRLAEEKKHIRQQWILRISTVSFLAVLIIILIIWQKKRKRNKIEITLREPISDADDNNFISNLTLTLQQFIEDSDVDMDRIASNLGMTRNVFYRRCREVMNSTPAALLQDMRIERACQLLDSGESRVKEVAWKSGFSDAKYFTKVFKSKKGITPTDYIAKTRVKQGE